MTNHSATLDRAFQALADPTRRAILARLGSGPASVSRLAEPFTMAMPTLLQHIRVLEQGGLIGTEKVGRTRICALRPDALRETEGWLARQRAAWEGRLDRLDAYLLTMKDATDES
ncbi:helix-turn-helix transcriptional regulator [Roseomonas frigidaquae]|uniref:Helix-turn-helix transcriptional regulator n=1 Tax=Falsiroseomonas frigidaquae TaxID=487318 RepID=A0ABX1F6B1_9PROT|nr:metalloregulator ArsR/SmtB family transcription factor [Falsiroseomonas frigidaquae]NKE47904.1 helix-turn-helix transcriptional regulator [Falsiroseomonas frigidaquae]